MKRGLLVLAIALVALAPANAWASEHHGGFVVVRPYAPMFHGPYPGPLWGPYWGWGPYWEPYWGPVYNAHPNTGQVKLDTKVKEAQVFINGAYAGTTHDNKTMYLRPGQYKIEIQEPGHTPFVENVYVVLDKTVHLRPDL